MRQGEERSRGHHFHLTVRSLLEILVIALFVSAFVVEPGHIPSGSMEPTLRVGDMMLTDVQAFAPEGWLGRWVLPPARVRRGDLVVFHFPPEPETELVKRVVGLPGDRVRLHEGRVWVNGAPLVEPYAFYSAAGEDFYRDEFPSLRSVDPNVDPRWWTALRQTISGGEVTVPAGCFFVLGDNRNESEDSRYWGFVRRGEMVGRPLVVYLGAGSWRERLRGVRVLR